MKSVQLKLVPLLFIAIVQFIVWAAPSTGAASLHHPKLNVAIQGKIKPVSSQKTRSSRLDSVPGPVSFRLNHERGLLADTWINGSGPYIFAIDTGAGGTIISERLANSLGVKGEAGRRISLSGLSGKEELRGYQAVAKSFALGRIENLLPANRTIIVSAGLPAGIDGILDPTDAYAPFGYVIDMPHHQISAFDCSSRALSFANPPPEGTVVRWLVEGGSQRPFVRLDGGQLALLDTGSGFGLAVNLRSGTYDRGNGRKVQDIGGGSVTSRRAEPSTVRIGSLTLRGVPTDLLSGVAAGTPTLLGRDALAPFRLVFDPLHRLIAIGPADR